MINHILSILPLLQSEQTWLLASEKVYSVLTVILIIVALFIVYLMYTNKRVSELEKKIKK